MGVDPAEGTIIGRDSVNCGGGDALTAGFGCPRATPASRVASGTEPTLYRLNCRKSTARRNPATIPYYAALSVLHYGTGSAMQMCGTAWPCTVRSSNQVEDANSHVVCKVAVVGTAAPFVGRPLLAV